MYLVIDNYDSFTYNIVQYLAQSCTDRIEVLRNDEISVEEIRQRHPKGIIISPGPGRPEDAGISLEIIRELGKEIPILGICLGHQVIAQAFGASIVQAKRIMHGKIDTIRHDGKGLFRALPAQFSAVRYHSLSVDERTLPEGLEITARSTDGEIMGIRHRHYLIEGLQFHPESIMSEEGMAMIENFLQYKRIPCDMTGILQRLMDGKDLTRNEAAEVMDELTEGKLSDAQTAAFLTALNMKGITEYEIAGCAQVLRDKCVPLPFDGPVLDTCGTGGDGLGTFNVSSFAAIVCAACGADVAKHGNRAVSSRSGSADFYEALGIRIDLMPPDAAELLVQTSFTFMFAPRYHKAMRHAAGVRRSLKVKTIMNILGPLVNPAGSEFQIIGVFDHALLVTVAKAAKLLGVKRVMCVHGNDGADEISVSGPTDICFIDEHDRIELLQISPEEFGLSVYPGSDLAGGHAEDNAQIARVISSGERDRRYEAVRTSVIMNAGAALFTVEQVPTIREGIQRAERALADHSVGEKLTQIIACSHRLAAEEQCV
jgi:anthranilate synthase/phosphoribosyltransferase